METTRNLNITEYSSKSFGIDDSILAYLPAAVSNLVPTLSINGQIGS